MKKKTFLLSLLSILGFTSAQAQTVEFYTPNTVRIVKDNGTNVEKKSLVVIAQPEKVKVSQSKKGTATVYKSSALTVTVDNGKVTFADNKGNFTPRHGSVMQITAKERKRLEAHFGY